MQTRINVHHRTCVLQGCQDYLWNIQLHGCQDDRIEGSHRAETPEPGDGFFSKVGQVVDLDARVGVQQLANHPLVPGLASFKNFTLQIFLDLGAIHKC